MAPKLKVLLTGATGRVGSILRREWGDRFELRLADIRELGDTSLAALTGGLRPVLADPGQAARA